MRFRVQSIFLKYPPVLSSALSPVPKETVYHVLIRLNHEQFLSQYTDLGHSVTLLLTERLMRQVRIMIFHIVTFTKSLVAFFLWFNVFNMINECVDTNPSSTEGWRVLFPDCCDGIFSENQQNRNDFLFYYSMHEYSGVTACFEHSNFFKVNLPASQDTRLRAP